MPKDGFGCLGLSSSAILYSQGWKGTGGVWVLLKYILEIKRKKIGFGSK